MPGGLVWYFGYGSLMWNPGFATPETQPARLQGWHRAFCIYSEQLCIRFDSTDIE